MVIKKHFILKEPYIHTNASVVKLLSSWNMANNAAKKRFNLYN
jgi:hypothetical protein